MNQPVPPAPQQPLPPQQPVYPYQAPYPVAPKTNTMAILSLVFAFLFPLLGAIFGFIANGQLKEPGRNETGKGLATAGIVIGLILTAIPVIVIVVLSLLAPAINSTYSGIMNGL